jgi:stress response protein YsnF
VIKLLDSHHPVDIMGRARTHGSSAAEPPKVLVPPPTSAAILKRDEEVVNLAEEQLYVGKRQVDTGITRVRRFIEEMEANVTLHEEHVEVRRRTISYRRDLKDIDWSEQIIEVRETVKQPVVNKTVRVAEEVVIQRKCSDHIEAVHDTARRQDLEVERLPAETVEE